MHLCTNNVNVDGADAHLPSMAEQQRQHDAGEDDRYRPENNAHDNGTCNTISDIFSIAILIR